MFTESFPAICVPSTVALKHFFPPARSVQRQADCRPVLAGQCRRISAQQHRNLHLPDWIGLETVGDRKFL